MLSGKDKGVKGKIIASFPEKQRVIVEGVNRITKHTKVGSTPVAPGPAASSRRKRRST